MNRRQWLRTAGGILAAPAVVRAESIMRVRPVVAVSVAPDLRADLLRLLRQAGAMLDDAQWVETPSLSQRIVVRTGLPVAYWRTAEGPCR